MKYEIPWIYLYWKSKVIVIYNVIFLALKYLPLCQFTYLITILTVKKPSRKSISNRDKGLDTFKLIGKADIAQSLIIQNNIVLGIEAAEGTDELIKRSHNYKTKGDQGILFKLSKYKQSTLIDIPTIGIKTLELLNLFNYEGVFLELNKCLILNQDQVINYANSNNLFISTINKIE